MNLIHSNHVAAEQCIKSCGSGASVEVHIKAQNGERVISSPEFEYFRNHLLFFFQNGAKNKKHPRSSRILVDEKSQRRINDQSGLSSLEGYGSYFYNPW